MKHALSILLILMLFGAVKAQTKTAGQNIDVQAKLTRGLTMNIIGSNATLDFGTLTLPISSAPTIDPAGQGDVQLQIVGDNNAPVTLTFPSSVTLTNGAANLTFTPNIEGNPSKSGNPGAVTNKIDLGPDGFYYLWVGGALPASIPTTQATGQYSGQFEITVAQVGS